VQQPHPQKERLVGARSEINIHRILSLANSTASLGDVELDGPFTLGIDNLTVMKRNIYPVRTDREPRHGIAFKFI